MLRLGRVLRALASHHVFKEVSEGRFANNHVSEALIGNSSLRSLIQVQYVQIPFNFTFSSIIFLFSQGECVNGLAKRLCR